MRINHDYWRMTIVGHLTNCVTEMYLWRRLAMNLYSSIDTEQTNAVLAFVEEHKRKPRSKTRDDTHCTHRLFTMLLED